MTDLTETFGPIISSYTRAEALADGAVIDVTCDKGATVYNTAVFVTAALNAYLTKGEGKNAETYSARLWDVCWMAAKVGKPVSESVRVTSVKIGARRVTVRAECGPVDIDDPRPAITLGLPEDF